MLCIHVYNENHNQKQHIPRVILAQKKIMSFFLLIVHHFNSTEGSPLLLNPFTLEMSALLSPSTQLCHTFFLMILLIRYRATSNEKSLIDEFHN